jgi:hypothetical protein
MIQPTTENKYRFNMLVSARAMGCRDRPLPQTGRERGAIDFRDISNGSRWRASRRIRQTVAQDCRCFGSASQIRDQSGRLASIPSRTEQEEPSS